MVRYLEKAALPHPDLAQCLPYCNGKIQKNDKIVFVLTMSLTLTDSIKLQGV